MEEPTRLELFSLDSNTFRRDMFIYGLWKSFLFQVVVVTLICFIEHVITQNWTGTCFLWIYLLGLGLLSRWSSLRQFAMSRLNREVWSSRQVEFDDEIYRSSSSSGTAIQVPFRNIVKVTEFRGYYLLFQSTVNVIYLPKQAFHLPSDEQRFRQCLFKYNLIKSVNL